MSNPRPRNPRGPSRPAPTEPAGESKRRPRMGPGDKIDRQQPDFPAAARDNAPPDDLTGDDAPVLMRVDEPDPAEPAETSTASEAADPNESYEMVTVFYATDRQRLEAGPAVSLFGKPMRPVLAGACVAVLLAVVGAARLAAPSHVHVARASSAC